MERNNVYKIKGNPMTLVGPELKVGDTAPDFTALDNDLQPVKFSDSKGKVRLISVVTSLDTPVCDTQTVTFNQKAAEMGDNIELYTISMDLPFAQKRFCAARAVEKLQTLSDYNMASFGENYGLLIKELRLLARSVLIVDENDKIAYMQVVPEGTQEPDYNSALEALKKIVK